MNDDGNNDTVEIVKFIEKCYPNDWGDSIIAINDKSQKMRCSHNRMSPEMKSWNGFDGTEWQQHRWAQTKC